MTTIETLQTGTILDRLKFVYGEEKASWILDEIEKLIAGYEGKIPRLNGRYSERDALLITYGDSIIGKRSPLEGLKLFLDSQVGNLISFLHLLPFYPYSSDDGFAVKNFREVRSDLGNWEQIRNLADNYRLVFDGVINHVSSSSVYAQGYFRGDSDYDDFFISLPPGTDTSAVLRTRNLPLLHDYPTQGAVKWLWTTFSRDQIDLNFSNPRVLLEIIDVLLFYASQGASMLRLDAIPYLWKELGTSCAHLPQTHELIKLIRDIYDVAAPHLLLLSETNVPHHENVSYFGRKGDEAQVIYNFTLAPLIVWSMYKGNASTLSEWARGLEYISERATYLNVTATHDGIGMRPTEGILSEEQRAEMLHLARSRGGDVTGKRNPDGSISPYELNLSYFDAINDPKSTDSLDAQVNRFMVSQAIPMALMGMPGIYIHSLLGSRNDYAGVNRTGAARSINRPQLQLETLHGELSDSNNLRSKVFIAYSRLLRQRSMQSAFHPSARQEILDLGAAVFAVRRSNLETGEEIVALHNVTGDSQRLSVPGTTRDLLGGVLPEPGVVELAPYQIAWLV